MIAAIIIDGFVVNRIVVDSLDGYVDGTASSIGDRYDPATQAFNRDPEPVIIPTEISSIQAKLAIADAGLMGAVQAFIALLPIRDQVYWDCADTFERTHPLIEQARIALGMTQEDIDNLFILAARTK